MKSFFEDGVYEEIINRINKLAPIASAEWGKIPYKHLDHHLRQFSV